MHEGVKFIEGFIQMTWVLLIGFACVGSNFILFQFCWRWVHKRCIRGKQKEYSMIKCQTYANQLTDIAGNYPGIELNGQSLKMVEKFYCLRDTIGTGRVRKRCLSSEI